MNKGEIIKNLKKMYVAFEAKGKVAEAIIIERLGMEISENLIDKPKK